MWREGGFTELGNALVLCPDHLLDFPDLGMGLSRAHIHHSQAARMLLTCGGGGGGEMLIGA